VLALVAVLGIALLVRRPFGPSEKASPAPPKAPMPVPVVSVAPSASASAGASASPSPRVSRELIGLSAPTVTRFGRTAVVDTGGTPWKAGCLIHQACPASSRVIKPCPKGKKVRPWSELSADAAALTGTQIEVSGSLMVASAHLEAMFACGRNQCCHHDPLRILLAGSPSTLDLASFGCRGDDSRRCCDVFADGRSVIATGKLQRPSALTVLSAWQLTDVSLCEGPL
jgi:hypothetical protein